MYDITNECFLDTTNNSNNCDNNTIYHNSKNNDNNVNINNQDKYSSNDKNYNNDNDYINVETISLIG